MSLSFPFLKADGSTDQEVLPAEIEDGLTALPEDHSLYFILEEAVKLVSVSDLVSLRARHDGIQRANGFMAAAARGELPKRKPIKVEQLPDGKWLVVDGNSTAMIARFSKWSTIPCLTSSPP